jgi:hypothetical protein
VDRRIPNLLGHAAVLSVATWAHAQDEGPEAFKIFDKTGFTVGETPPAPSVEIKEKRGNLAGAAFVRFQVTAFLQATVGMQGIFHPVNSPDDAAAVFTARLRATF